MLTTPPTVRLKSSDSDVATQKSVTYCDKLLHPKKLPRPEDLPWNVFVIQSDPPSVDIDDVEEFLVHDALFVDFFNAFLSLPTFPEPICFNMESGGFEVLSDGRQRLARKIKEAVRSQNFTPKMYRLARQHAFSDIPLIPIEDTDGPEGVKIDTSFQVTTLNKDQGIYWIKAERFPIFLESDFYFQYRLAKVISQARLFNDSKEFVIMTIDFTPRQKKVKKSIEVPPPNLEEIIVKQMYVSFGDVKGAAKEAWFTQAKNEISTNPTFTSLDPKVSIDTIKEKSEKRPKSSVFCSNCFGVYTPGIVGLGKAMGDGSHDRILKEQMFNSVEDRPFTPRPSDNVHVSTESMWKMVRGSTDGNEDLVKPGHVVFLQPKQDSQMTDTESGIGEMDEKDEELERRVNIQPIIDQIYEDGSWNVGENVGIPLKSVNELGSVIVGAVMKKALADMLWINEKVVIEDPVVSSIYPSEELTCIDVDTLEKCYVIDNGQDSEDEENKPPAETFSMEERIGHQNDTPSPAKEPVHVKWNREVKKSAEEESDADSLLDSDEDFEERDIHFRRRKDKWYNLTSMKGIMNFKRFLVGTPGEKYWELWIDIDKGHLLQDKEEEQRYSMYMRERYFKQGSQFELSKEDKRKLGLESTGRWCMEYLFQIHGKVMEPLVLYWAPRYLLRNLLQSDPEKYYMYSQMKASKPLKESDPHPMTESLLPLRPKSCCPRTRQGPGIEEMNSVKNRINSLKANEAEFITSPKVGGRRIYGEDTIQRLANTPTAKYLGIVQPPKKKKESELEKRFSRPETASSYRSLGKGDDAAGTPKMASARSREGSIWSFASDSKDRASGNKSSFVKQNDEGFVGRLPGIGSRSKLSRTSARKSQDSGSASIASDKPPPHHRSASSAKFKLETPKPKSSSPMLAGSKGPCPQKNLGNIFRPPCTDRAASGEYLGPVKKPRDLLSPMLRILDTKEQRSKRTPASLHRSTSLESEQNTFFRQDSMDSSKVCNSHPTSGTVKSSSIKGPPVLTDMTDCDFMGSERMELLLQALHHDREAGKALKKYMERNDNNQLALNCFEFWDFVQEHRKLFYKDKLDLFHINKQAKGIFAQFIVEGSPKSIEVSNSVELRIMERLKPVYEDLFDDAEEHALKVLFAEFLDFLNSDIKTYCKVERAEITRRLETKNTYILNLQKKGIIKERPLTPEDPMEGYVDPVYDEFILERIPEEFREWTFDKLVHNRMELEHFRQYLAENYAEVDLKCWMDMEAWRRTAPNETRKRDQRARDIRKIYLNKKYFFGPSSPAGKGGQNKVMLVAGGWGKFLEDKPNSEMILEAQKYVLERLEKKHLPLFLLTREFHDRQAPRHSSTDMTDDIVVQKKRRSQAVLKLLESKWVSSAKEIFIFKQALKNHMTCQQFQKYVSIKGDNLENDLLFWLEVQHYKQMHHVHTEDSMLMQKINAIIHCFIDSTIPPSLQIDIPQEMAENILDHKHEKGPYIFREAQLATFRILLTHWTPFCEFRNNMGSDNRAMKTLERHLIVSKKKEAEYEEQLENQKQREKLLRTELDLSDHDELPDQLKEQDDDIVAKISFSYADHIVKEPIQAIVEEDGTQTIRSMLEKSLNASSRQGSEKSVTAALRGEKTLGEEEDLLLSLPRRTSGQTERRQSQLSVQTSKEKGGSKKLRE